MSNEVVMILRILLATTLGGIIGFQREKAHKAAGLRTHMLICIGSALFTIISIFGFSGFPAQVAAGIVAGVGFIGAGAILSTREGNVHGLTTAASIWMSAGIGMAAGAGLYLIAVVTAMLGLAVLMIHPRIAR
jgi:putative Mg2+ transporter-C (MgtC) family protein